MDNMQGRIREHREFVGWLTANGYLDYPIVVGFETYALCNATCGFCPYPGSARTGEKMADRLIQKIVEDLRDIPESGYLEMIPNGINEPFLDTRLFDILELINARLPRVGLRLNSNGSALNAQNIERLSHVRNFVKLNISLNERLPQQYREVMGLPFERTVANIAALHRAAETGTISFPITLSRVGDGTSEDDEFAAWVNSTFPRFKPDVLARGDFMGQVQFPSPRPAAPDVGCSQWFKLHIMPSGKISFCCMDADGTRGFDNAGEKHLLEIYNAPARRRLRAAVQSRLDLPGCDTCTVIV